MCNINGSAYAPGPPAQPLTGVRNPAQGAAGLGMSWHACNTVFTCRESVDSRQ